MVTILRKMTSRATLLCMLVSLPLATATTSVVAADFDKPVFEFQKKLADRGSASAQYFLAQMYEEGRGTDTNPELAKHWYEQARLNGYIAEEQIASSR